jgi:hypothetical protein
MEARVSTLIDPTTGWWNSQLIQELFSPEEVDWIYIIIPSPLRSVDSLFWQGTPHGEFTVRSAGNNIVKHKIKESVLLLG